MVGQIELQDYLKSINRESLNILDYIPTGRMNAITRHALAIRTGISDRQVRDLIHYARRDIPILNMQDGRGYFIPDMNDEVERGMLAAYVRQEENRLRSIGWSLASARQTCRNCGIDWRASSRNGIGEKARRAGIRKGA